jgi:hypothetical protein
MTSLIYCYGPLSVDKNLFCKNFTSENKNYKSVDLLKIRKKHTGSIAPAAKEKELELNNLIINTCSSLLSQNKSIIVNGLFLNDKSRASFIDFVRKNSKSNFKSIAVAFPVKSLPELYEDNKREKIFKDVTFDHLRFQISNFTQASTLEEGDLLINKIENSEDKKIKIDTKLWQEDRVIYCSTFKKVSEYFKYATSFN